MLKLILPDDHPLTQKIRNLAAYDGRTLTTTLTRLLSFAVDVRMLGGPDVDRVEDATGYEFSVREGVGDILSHTGVKSKVTPGGDPVLTLMARKSVPPTGPTAVPTTARTKPANWQELGFTGPEHYAAYQRDPSSCLPPRPQPAQHQPPADFTWQNMGYASEAEYEAAEHTKGYGSIPARPAPAQPQPDTAQTLATPLVLSPKE